VNIDRTVLLFTPGKKKTSSEASLRVLKNSGVKISPDSGATAMRTRFAPPNSAECFKKTCM
jgi:hypothetical protein